MTQLVDRYRPKTLDDVVGNERAVNLFRRLIQSPFPSAWLLEGKSGIGKTSVARIVAKSLATNIMDYQTYNGRDVDQRTAEEIRDRVQTLPWNGGFRVVVVDEADQMTEGAQVAFLSILENLGSRSIVLMTSNEKDDFEPRFLSRVKVVPFTTMGMGEAGARFLVRVAAENGVTLSEADGRARMQNSKNNLRAALQDLEVEIMLVADFGA